MWADGRTMVEDGQTLELFWNYGSELYNANWTDECTKVDSESTDQRNWLWGFACDKHLRPICEIPLVAP